MFLSKKWIKWNGRTADYRTILTLSSGLIWWDCFKMGSVSVVGCQTCFHSTVLILFRANNAEGEALKGKINLNIISKEHIISDPVIPVVDEAPRLFIFTAMTPNISITVLAASVFTSCASSMDVQGDYDPCDASGFIRINAVRSATAEPVFILTHCLTANISESLFYCWFIMYILSFYNLLNPLFFLTLHPFCSSPQVAGTSSFAGFLLHEEVSAAGRWTTATVF